MIEFVIIFTILGTIISAYSLYFAKKESSHITQINDKVWIVDNKLVSYEENTPLLIYQQKREDDKHYQAYESYRLKYDRDRIYGDYIRTISAIKEYPELSNFKIDIDKLSELLDKYQQYKKMCLRLNISFILSQAEFFIKELNPAYCVDFTTYCIMVFEPVGCYNVYNKSTARYLDDMQNKIRQEYKEKWY